MPLDDNDNPLSFKTLQVLTMYANGERVDDIANKYRVTVNTVYKWMNEHPEEYKKAKGELAALRNAKYRRAGMLAIDKQLFYLESMDDDDPEVLSKEMATIIKIGETAEKRADLNEGKATEITKEIGTKFIIEMPPGFEGENLKKHEDI